MVAIIQAEQVGKRYTLHHQREASYQTFRSMLTGGAARTWRRLFGATSRQQDEEFWALRDLSFSIEKGERVGIIGRNGAGKSTLLKILSRITEPTEGRIRLRGRVGSLIEVGTGFHPELTGRENIYLNGAILGMSRVEIRKKFDEIVAFSEVEKFLDTPVKRYSSGMYVRLAFAVAAHLEPEVLIVDEVLAVGDARFQKKCLNKMESVAAEGRSILFVSHNMDSVRRLCNRTLWLDGGRVIEDTTDIGDVARRYLFDPTEAKPLVEIGDARANDYIDVRKIYVADANGAVIDGFVSAADAAFVYFEVDIKQYQEDINIGYALCGETGDVVYWSCATDRDYELWPRLENGRCVLRCQIPPHLLNEGLYRVEGMVSLQFKRWLYAPKELPAVVFRVQGGLSNSPFWISAREGVIAPVLSWDRVA